MHTENGAVLMTGRSVFTPGGPGLSSTSTVVGTGSGVGGGSGGGVASALNGLALLDMLRREVAAENAAPEKTSRGGEDEVLVDADDLDSLRQAASPGRLVDFSGLSQARMLLLLNVQRAQLDHVDVVLAKNYDFYRTMFVEPVVDRVTALAAASSYSPGMLLELPLTLKQVDAMLRELCSRVRGYGVEPPVSWQATAQEVVQAPEDRTD